VGRRLEHFGIPFIAGDDALRLPQVSTLPSGTLSFFTSSVFSVLTRNNEFSSPSKSTAERGWMIRIGSR
jgi:hypothetical protein